MSCEISQIFEQMFRLCEWHSNQSDFLLHFSFSTLLVRASSREVTKFWVLTAFSKVFSPHKLLTLSHSHSFSHTLSLSHSRSHKTLFLHSHSLSLSLSLSLSSKFSHELMSSLKDALIEAQDFLLCRTLLLSLKRLLELSLSIFFSTTLFLASRRKKVVSAVFWCYQSVIFMLVWSYQKVINKQ